MKFMRDMMTHIKHWEMNFCLYDNCISAGILYISMVAYLFLPLLIFVFKWVNIFLALPIIIITIIAIFFSIKIIYRLNWAHIITSTPIELMVVFLFFILFCVFMGHGDLFPQDFDWHKHHAIYYDLLNYEWPVVYKNNSMLTYYLGQYIVPAFVGKLFRNSAGVMIFFIPIWNAFGLTMIYSFIAYYLNAESKTKKIVILLAIIFWGGCTNIGQEIYKLLGYDIADAFQGNFKWIDIDRIRVHFASNYDALYGAFQHVIAPWISSCLFLGNRKWKEGYMLMSLPLLFTASFGFIYFSMILLIFAFYDFLTSDSKKQEIKRIFSWGNFLLLPVMGVVVIYLFGNFFGEKPKDVGTGILPMGEYLDFYFIFIVVEFLGYAFFLYFRNKHNLLFYVVVIQLMFIPFFSMGLFNDLCSRGSIPARFILMILCIEQLYNYNLRRWENVGLITLLLIAALNTEVEIWAHTDRAIAGRFDRESYLADDYRSFEGYAGDIEVAGREDNAYNYFTLNYSESMFYKIAVRK